MKLVHPDFFCPIDFEKNKIPVLILENQIIFRNFLEELKNQLRGEEGSWILSEQGNILKLTQYCSMIIDPFSLDINQKKILMSVYSKLEKEVNTTELIVRWNTILSSLFHLSDELMDAVDYELNYRNTIDIIDFFKFLDIRFCKNTESLIELFIDYCNLTREVIGVKLFILINIKAYLTNTELLYLYEQAFYKDYKLLLIESKESEEKNIYENITIIDKDGCVIC